MRRWRSNKGENDETSIVEIGFCIEIRNVRFTVYSYDYNYRDVQTMPCFLSVPPYAYGSGRP
jgi:hypothetical protein